MKTCGTDEANGEQPKKQYRVTYRETAYYDVLVWAEDEGQARELAHDTDLGDDSYGEEVEFCNIEEVEE